MTADQAKLVARTPAVYRQHDLVAALVVLADALDIHERQALEQARLRAHAMRATRSATTGAAP